MNRIQPDNHRIWDFFSFNTIDKIVTCDTVTPWRRLVLPSETDNPETTIDSQPPHGTVVCSQQYRWGLQGRFECWSFWTLTGHPQMKPGTSGRDEWVHVWVHCGDGGCQDSSDKHNCWWAMLGCSLIPCEQQRIHDGEVGRWATWGHCYHTPSCYRHIVCYRLSTLACLMSG